MLSTQPFVVPPALLQGLSGPPAPTAVVAANSAVVLESVKAAVDLGLIAPILIGNRRLIEEAANATGFDLSRARIVQAATDHEAATIGTGLARLGEAQILMKGHIHTDEIMRAALSKTDGLRAGRRFTHVSQMTVPGCDKALYMSDVAVNVLPDAATRMDIVRNMVDVARACGLARPKVALLSATEDVNPAMPSSQAAYDTYRAFTAAGEDLGFDIAGPMAFDNAMSPKAAQIKGVKGPVAGQADALVMPNIETGNALMKMMVYFMSATLAGIVMGAKVPIVLTSRADPAEARLASIALARRIGQRAHV